jgi:hypothetical protein
MSLRATVLALVHAIAKARHCQEQLETGEFDAD